MVSMLTAALDEPWTGKPASLEGLSGSEARLRQPTPLET